MNTTKPKILVVGGGSAGVRHYRYSREFGAEVSLYDPADRCRVTEQFPDCQHIQEYREKSLETYDAVIVCTPPALHVRQALIAARAGCHVMTEKPLGVTEDGIDDLEAILAENHLIGAVSFPFANMRAVDRIFEIIESGEVGNLWMAAIHRGENILKSRPDYFETFYVSEAKGGGCLQDDANHALTALELLGGQVVEVTCQRHHIGIKDTDSDDTAFVWLRFANGVVASLDWSNQCNFEHFTWIISTSQGGVRFSMTDDAAAPMRIEVYNSETQATRIEKFDQTWNDTFRNNDRDFIEAIQGKGKPRCSIAQARRHLRTVLAAKESSRARMSVRLDDRFVYLP